jgi:hypothetical protein
LTPLFDVILDEVMIQNIIYPTGGHSVASNVSRYFQDVGPWSGTVLMLKMPRLRPDIISRGSK